GIETRLSVALAAGPALRIPGDPDQLDQLLINLLRNAADAALETGGGVKIGWRKNGKSVEVWIDDEGPGLSGTTNLFVPFFTTKPYWFPWGARNTSHGRARNTSNARR